MANSSVLLVMLPRQLLDNVLQGRQDIETPVKQIIGLRDVALEQSTLARTWPFVEVPHELLDEVGTAFDQVDWRSAVESAQLTAGSRMSLILGRSSHNRRSMSCCMGQFWWSMKMARRHWQIKPVLWLGSVGGCWNKP